MTALIVVAIVGLILVGGVIIVSDDRSLSISLSFIGYVIFLFVAAFCIALIQEYRAFDAIIACEVKRMEARRPALGTRVVCVPGYATKADTLTVQTPDLRRPQL